jgi:tetratricopeptide (TPR) repeat protein
MGATPDDAMIPARPRLASVRGVVLGVVLGAASPCVLAAQGDAASLALHLNAGFAQRRNGDLASAVRSFERAVAADSTVAVARFELAYALLAVGRKPDAIAHLEGGVRADPANTEAFRQLGYLYAEAGQLDASLRAFDTAGARGALRPRDRLQVGYVHARRGDGAAARRAFALAAVTDDSLVANAARAALAQSAASTPPAPTGRVKFAELYAAPLYQSRFSNAIAQGVARTGIVLGGSARLSPYASLRGSRDTRSTGGRQPVIFSDNVILPALGVRVQPLPGLDDALQLYAEAGPALALVDAGAPRRTTSDVRAGGYYNRQWRAGAPGPGDRTPLALVTDLYVDASYYSRFDDDVIGFAQLRESVPVLDVSGRGADVFARVWTVADTRRVYYNNAVETSAGVTLFAERARRAFVMIEHVRGTYHVAPGAGVDRRYRDTRATLVISDFRSWR